MVLKVLILCAVSVFCGSSALSTFGKSTPQKLFSKVPVPTRQPYYEVPHKFFSEPQDPNDFPVERIPEVTAVQQDKEYVETKQKYYVSQNKLSWNDARDACTARGMALATVMTPSQQMDITDYLINHSLAPKDQYSGYWIGCRRQATYDPWIWETNGEELTDEFSFWLPYEPSSDFKGEDCMEYKNDGYGMGWNNYFCNDLRGYICETLPFTTHESEKNFVQDSKDTIHEELLKEFVEDKDETEEDNQNVSTDSIINIKPVTDKYIVPENSYPTESDQAHTDDGWVMPVKPYFLNHDVKVPTVFDPEHIDQTTDSDYRVPVIDTEEPARMFVDINAPKNLPISVESHYQVPLVLPAQSIYQEPSIESMHDENQGLVGKTNVYDFGEMNVGRNYFSFPESRDTVDSYGSLHYANSNEYYDTDNFDYSNEDSFNDGSFL